jgi:hypothetical protein
LSVNNGTTSLGKSQVFRGYGNAKCLELTAYQCLIIKAADTAAVSQRLRNAGVRKQ